ncbi:MAG: hypothetical protein ABSF41_06595 [Pseudolabrys sp.]|jgi:hypothetical protein
MADVCISTVADRHALHSVYYSAMKKTALDLTKHVSAACDARRNVVRIVHARCDIARDECGVHGRAQIAEIAKPPMK